MASHPPFKLIRIIPIFLLGVTAFSVPFSMARHQSLKSSLRWGEALLGQAGFLLEQGDEMGLIDWGKALEGNAPLAFRLIRSPEGPGERVLVEGGDLQRLGSTKGRGMTLGPFSSWVHLVLESSRSGSALRLALTHRIEFPPWNWGFLGSFLVLIGYILRERTTSSRTEGNGSNKRSPAFETPAPLEGPSLHPEEGAWVLLDQGFVILRVSPLALDHLGVPKEGPRPTHLLDLTPAQDLMPSFVRQDQGGMEGAFSNRPELWTEWTRQPEGTLLLVLTQGPKRPKTH